MVDFSKTGLAKPYQAAGNMLQKRNLTGLRLPVYLVIDHSGSMAKFFRDGTVQTFAERILALAAHFDDDGTVPVILFDNTARRPVDIDVSNYQGAIDRIKKKAGGMGGTDYVSAMQAVANLHSASQNPYGPAFVVFQTDGAPASRARTTEYLRTVSGWPIFWQFVGFGDEQEVPPGEEARFDYLRKLDTLTGRVVDNAGFFPAGANPSQMNDDELYDNLTAEFPLWLDNARRAQIIH